MSKILQTVIILTAIIVFYPVSQTVAADEQKSILITGVRQPRILSPRLCRLPSENRLAESRPDAAQAGDLVATAIPSRSPCP